MNVPQPVPMPAMPPPPPPKKSNTLKWVLIGCGGFAFLGILACGGCALLIGLAMKKAINEGVAKVRPIIAENETVRKEIGELRDVSPRWEMRKEVHNGKESLSFTLDVEGDKGKGTVLVHMSEARRRDDELFISLTFVTADGSKRTPIGTWRVYDDKKGNSGFERVEVKPEGVVPQD